MTTDVVALAPPTSLKDAADTFLARGISGAPVVEGGRLVGVLSESDIVGKETSGFENGAVGRAEAGRLRREREARTVAEAMTPEAVTARPWWSIWAAADAMAANDVNRLPVVDGRGAVVGLVTRDDLVRAFARSDAAIERDIREHVLPSVELSPRALGVEVENGVVTVSGRVESELAGDCLRRTIRFVPGVVEVRWQVELRARPAVPGDEPQPAGLTAGSRRARHRRAD